MVNESKGKKYEPVMVFNRKLARGIIRSRVERELGYHNVSKQMAEIFKTQRQKEKLNHE